MIYAAESDYECATRFFPSSASSFNSERSGHKRKIMNKGKDAKNINFISTA